MNMSGGDLGCVDQGENLWVGVLGAGRSERLTQLKGIFDDTRGWLRSSDKPSPTLPIVRGC